MGRGKVRGWLLTEMDMNGQSDKWEGGDGGCSKLPSWDAFSLRNNRHVTAYLPQLHGTMAERL